MMTLIDPCAYVIQQATKRAKSLAASGAVRWADWEDARQDLILDYLRRSPRFDPARGELAGFIYGVMANHSAVLFARMIRWRRRAG